MGFLIKFVLGILFSLYAALIGWLFFPDRIVDLSYWEWFAVSIVVETIVSTALIGHDLAKD